MSRQNIITTNIIMSILIFAIFILSWELIHQIIYNFFSVINKTLSSLTTSIIDTSILSLIPLISMTTYWNKTDIKLKKIFSTNLFAFSITLVTLFIGLLMLIPFSKPTSPFIPQNIIIMPYDSYPTTLILIGIIIYLLVANIVKRGQN